MKKFKVTITYTNEYTIEATSLLDAMVNAKNDIKGFKDELEVDDFKIKIKS